MMKSTKIKYEMTIAWSEEDNCYLVGFPDFLGQKWRTHGDTYETVVKNGVETLESLMIAYEASSSLCQRQKLLLVAGFRSTLLVENPATISR
jgi:antitoxin HicB